MKIVLLFHFALVAVMLSACGELNEQAQVEEFSASTIEENSTQLKSEDNVTEGSSNIVITTTTKTDENSDDTNSSSDELNSTEENLTDFGNNPVINDPNDTGSPDNNGSSVPSFDDTNASNDTNTTISTNDTNSTVIITNPLYDSTDAVVDLKACKIDFGMKFLTDHHENNEGLAKDDVNGVTIRSLYPSTGSQEESLVMVIFNKISDTSEINNSLEKLNTYGDNAHFILSFDRAWLNEEKNIFYVKTPALDDKLKKCFRLGISEEYNASDVNQSIYDLDFTFQKVYR